MDAYQELESTQGHLHYNGYYVYSNNRTSTIILLAENIQPVRTLFGSVPTFPLKYVEYSTGLQNLPNFRVARFKIKSFPRHNILEFWGILIVNFRRFYPNRSCGKKFRASQTFNPPPIIPKPRLISLFAFRYYDLSVIT